MNLLNIFASLKLDKTDYEKGLNEAKKEGEQFAEHTEKKVSPMAVAGWAAIIAAIMKAVQAIAKLAKESIDYADTVSDLAAQYGVTTDAISEMQYIAEQSSTSVEGLSSAMSMLYMRAKQNGDAFKKLGISVKDEQGNFKSMDELFWETTGALNDMESEGEKSAYMLDLFGRSAMNIGEVLRKSSDEIATMRQEAHDLGVVMGEDTVKFASDFNDQMAVLKMQGKSALASLVAGAPDAEERFQLFIDNITEKLEEYVPRFINFAVRLLTQAAIALVKVSPQLTVNILDAVIDTIFSVDWLKVGIDIGKSILEGLINIIVSGLNAVLGVFGVEIPKFSFGGEENTDYTPNFEENLEGYEITENVTQDININIEASGDTTVSQETAEKTAEALAPYIDKILGSK